ncbi:MerR family transcriptional regulator [Deinococcus pimensis]|uniref:MerR family transcriptional regulator n=1 Tax=Deinococcus pimensis TaxID=309888 RepID=UPI0004893338|nr:MerR family transcriptional regulator [Deinococcus pimensis]
MFQIGEFARLANVSVRTLHHYDDLGLLEPAGRTASGYRLYDASQLATLRRVVTLTRLGFTLDEVRAVTRGELQEPFAHLLARKHDELIRARAALDTRLAGLRAELEREERMSTYTVQLKRLPPQTVLAVRRSAPDYRHVTAPMNAAYDVVCRVHADLGLVDAGWSVVTWRGGGYASEDTIDLEVALPVFGRLPRALPDEVRALTQPELLVVSTVHAGSYERFGEAYAALLDWIHRRGYAADGPVREVYLRHGRTEDEHLSELQVPVRTA